MSRGLGVAESLAETLEPLEPALALLTQLGDVWFLLALGTAAYWLGARSPRVGWDRRHGLLVLGVGVLAVAATYLLKQWFGLPRPPGAGRAAYDVGGPLGVVYADAATGHGYGFPSGHAVSATAVYATLAWIAPWGRRSVRVGAAAVLIALVAFTRLGLGVHYLVDVVAGAAVGVVVAAVAVRLVARPGAVLVLAVATAGGRALLGPVGPKTAALLGLAAGMLAAWAWLDVPAGPAGRRRQFGPVVVGAVAGLAGGALLAVVGLHAAGVTLGALAGGLLVVGLSATLWPEKSGSDAQNFSR